MGEQVKLKTVLNNILKGDFKISDREKWTIIENVKKEASIIEKLSVNIQIYYNWIQSALLLWERQGPSNQPLIFVLDILIEFNKNKNIFVLLHQNNIFKRIIKMVKMVQDIDVIRSYIRFLDTFTHTEFGRNWLIGSFDFWKDIFHVIPCRKFTEELSIFLKDLFLEVVECSELFFLDLSKLILDPLTILCAKIMQNGLLWEELIPLIPTINLLSSVILCISESITLDHQWLKKCNNLLNLKKPLKSLLAIVEEEELTLEVSKLLTGLLFLELIRNQDKLNSFFDNNIKLLDIHINYKFLDNLTILSFQVQEFWFHVCRLIDVEKLKLTFDFGLFVAMYQVTPFYGMCIQILGGNMMSTIENDELRDDFEWNLSQKLTLDMYMNFYRLRDMLLELDNFVPSSLLALELVEKSFHLLNKESKIMFYCCMLYFIGDILTDIQKNGTLISPIYDINLLVRCINALIFYAENCEISLKDGVDHMLTLDILTDLMQLPDLPNDLVEAALKMLDLAIAKHMAPDLHLLMDCNSMNSIGPLLESKLNSESVGVRCAASKVLVTISESANNYPFFQKVLLKCNLPQQLWDRIFTKEVIEVRCNSMKCLQHFVKIDSLWQAVTSREDIVDIIINSLKTETENQLRAEVVNVAAVIYQEDFYTDVQIKNLYEIMKRLGVHDFDVAVRINSLKFWSFVIDKLLIEEGMIDGEFPEVTFSKKSRKIVVLNEDEIKRRLNHFMDKLSRIGCLTVLNSCFSSNEKSEKQCVDKIVENLLSILEKYEVIDRLDLCCDKLSKMSCQTFVLDDLDTEILTPKEFLENVTQPSPYNDEEYIRRQFIQTLEQILKHNNLNDLDTLDSYL